MDKPQFNPDDKPVFNLFDLPAFCEETSPATKPCCGPCTDWLFCIKRSPIELKLPGFDFSAWLPSVSMCATKIMPSSGVDEAEFTNTDGSNEFDGTYLTLPDSHFLLEGDCGTRTAIALDPAAWGLDSPTRLSCGHHTLPCAQGLADSGKASRLCVAARGEPAGFDAKAPLRFA